MTRVYFITGTSSGFGRALAEAVLARGDIAVMTARRTDRVADLAARYPLAAMVQRMDVTDPADRNAAVEAALARFGRIDVLVNNAGRGSLGAAEEFSLAQLRDELEINFVACAEMIRAVLPSMRQQKSGHLINISSIGGRVNVGGFALYGASKFALEGYSEALYDEVKPMGIRVTVIEPGAFRTEFAGDANVKPAQTIADYVPVLEPIRQYLYGSTGKQPGDPTKAAQAIVRVVESEAPPLRLMLGADAYGLWEQKRAAADAEIAAWRTLGEATAFDDTEVKAIGG